MRTPQLPFKSPYAARFIAALLPVLMFLGGCATAQGPDPFESLNRKTFAFNEALDKAVLKPVARAYASTLPSPVRTGVSNFFSNTKDAWSGVNLFMQGKPRDGTSDFMRFGTNTVFGVLGVFDIATGLGMEKHGQDFGQTLASWGVGSGAYMVWPLLGPSSVRDSLAMPVNSAASLLGNIDNVALSNSLTVMQLASTRAALLPASDMIDMVALDKYLFVRDAYLQRSNSHVRRVGQQDAPDTPAMTGQP